MSRSGTNLLYSKDATSNERERQILIFNWAVSKKALTFATYICYMGIYHDFGAIHTQVHVWYIHNLYYTNTYHWLNN